MRHPLSCLEEKGDLPSLPAQPGETTAKAIGDARLLRSSLKLVIKLFGNCRTDFCKTIFHPKDMKVLQRESCSVHSISLNQIIALE
jgi:hypothetical protein